MLVILKIPVVYLCLVVWWAIRAEPRAARGAGRLAPAPTRARLRLAVGRAAVHVAGPSPPRGRRPRRQARPARSKPG